MNIDLRLFLTSVLREEPWSYDPKVIPIPWRSQEEENIKHKFKSGGMNLGFFNCDGNVRFIRINNSPNSVVDKYRSFLTRQSLGL